MRIGGAALVPNAEGPAPNRWLIAVACVTVQTGLGTVYSWSVYRRPLSEAFGWSITEVTMTFSVLILTAGFAAFLGGVWMRRSGPRRVAVCAGVLYGAGLGLASLSADRLPLLYLTYGLIGGAGVGLGYIVPIATLIKWFPDRTGFITGVAVTGVAAGSLLASPIAARLIESIGVLDTFAVLGAVYLILVVGAALALRDPPAGYRPAGWTPPGEGGDSERRTFDLRGALRTWQWYLLWAIFFLNAEGDSELRVGKASPSRRMQERATPFLVSTHRVRAVVGVGTHGGCRWGCPASDSGCLWWIGAVAFSAGRTRSLHR